MEKDTNIKKATNRNTISHNSLSEYFKETRDS